MDVFYFSSSIAVAPCRDETKATINIHTCTYTVLNILDFMEVAQNSVVANVISKQRGTLW